jgi:uncharacterized repeat protein (TIGR01451 family)
MSTPRVYQIRQRAKLTRRFFGPVNRSTTFLILFFILLATALYSGSSASTFRAKSGSRQPKSVVRGEDKLVKGKNNSAKEVGNLLSNRGVSAILPRLTAGLLMAPQQPIEPETVTTYAADCATPKIDFHFGDTVCAKIDGGATPLSIASRRFSWVDPYNRVLARTNVTTLPQTDLFVLPARDPNNDTRGVWRVNSISSRSSVRASAFFNLSDPNNAAADVLVYNNINTDASDVAAGSNIEFALWATNKGPNAATNVQIESSVNGGATFITTAQDSGPAFSCNPSAGGVTCTISSLAAGDSARIRVVYQVSGGASAGTIIANTATISSDTPDQFPENNTFVAQLIVTDNSGGSFCSLGCPGNIFKPADTTQSGQNGAFVTFGTGETSGECGTVTSSPASGSFFPTGTTTVTQSSSTGESCTFNVTVTEGDDPPTISCPANVQKDAGNDCSAEVTAAELGAPTATGTGVTVEGNRSDSLQLEQPYPVGTTTITWTATDERNRTASCSQTVTVTGTDTTPPTLTVPPDVTDSTGAAGVSCGKIVGESELGTVTAEDNCSTATVTRTGVPTGNFFPLGETIITYTATDGTGHTTTGTQKVTITDNTPPVIEAPADASYVCPSDVPAASPSQATSGDVFDANGNLLPPAPPSDNCGVPTVAVSETSSGAGSASSPRIILRTFTATDAAGNSASDTQTITVIDNVPPSITLNGASSATVECHTSFTDSGASASDNCAGVAPVAVSGSVDVNAPGTYTLSYTATDAAGNQSSTLTRTVTVVDTIPPSIALNGASTLTVECHTAFNDPGATASDSCAGDLTSAITVAGSVNANVVGSYSLTYSVSDGQGHNASVNRTVNVVDTIAPTITLNGANPLTVECHTSFTDPGATANDGCAGAVAVTASGSVNANVPGTYTITYSAHDPSNNTTTTTRTVNVVDTTAPTITLKNVNLSFWPPNHKYKTVLVTDLVQSASDGCDGGVDINDVYVSKVTSDEAVNDDGDGNTTDDIIIGANCKSVQLRSERSGGGNGRVYTITFKVKDAAGNSKTVTAKVSVPHNNGSTAIDSGVAYTVTSGCP